MSLTSHEYVPVDDFDIDNLEEGWMNKRQKLCGMNRTMKRWQLLLAGSGICCCLFLIFCAIFLVLFFIVITPILIQNTLDDSDIEFTNVVFTHPRLVAQLDENGKSTVVWKIDMQSSARVNSSSSLHLDAKILPNTLSIYKDGDLLGTVPVPEQDVGGSHTDVSISSTLTIADPKVYTKLASELLREDYVTSTLYAKVDIRISSFSRTYKGLTFNKTIRSKGLDGMKTGHGVKSLNLTVSNSSAVKFISEAYNFNPTHYQIEPLGDLRADLYYKGVLMANILARNLSLEAGNNSITLEGIVVVEPTPHNLKLAGELMKMYLSNESAILDTVATQDATSIELYRPALVGFSFESHGKPLDKRIIEEIRVEKGSVVPIDNTHVGLYDTEIINVVDVIMGPQTEVSIYNASIVTDVYYQNKLMGTLTGPPITILEANQTEQHVDLESTLELNGQSGEDLFVAFADEFLRVSELQVEFRNGIVTTANVSVPFGMVPLFDVKLNPLPVTVLGLNNLPGIIAEDLDMPRNAPNGGVVLTATAVITNPSVTTMYTGSPVFTMSYKGVNIGTTNSTDVILKPGVNRIPLEGVLKFAQKDSAIVQEMFDAYLTGKDATVQGNVTAITGKYAGITWVQRAAKNVRLSNVIPPLDEARREKLVGPPFINNATLRFSGGGANIVHMSENITGSFNPPFAFPIRITEAAGEAMAYDLKSGKPLANFTVPLSPVESSFDSHILTFQFYDRLLELPADLTAMESIAVDYVTTKSVTFGVVGTITKGVTESALGPLVTSGVAFRNNITLQGLNNFRDQPPRVQDLSIFGAHEWGLEIGGIAEFYNPTVTVYEGGLVVVDLFVYGADSSELVYIGNATLDPIDLQMGWNSQAVTGYYVEPEGDKKQYGVRFLQNFVEGKKQPGVMKGTYVDTPFLMKAAQALQVNVDIPGIGAPLIMEARITNFNFFAFTLDVQMHVENTFNVTLDLKNLNFVIYLSSSGEKLGVVTDKKADIVPANGVIWTDPVTVDISSFAQEIFALFEILFGGSSQIDAEGTIEFELEGAFDSTIPYRQDKIPVVN